ncbi:uncharacterized protein LOC122056941 [Macadamia integrifolia]|uniref:uncharacterized protein LOC122056941 n=1 Tax=Macadamia integrifolia TaxID=60698 RepID=UPI001C52D822|nr:uncharacterized protein LOC122056941 [Macadamia integrifolia]XP_042474841.1 uncharacterized protein LOC122056941 [Macadamia integrifolia]
MDNMACVQVPPIVRKEKKKQGKDELDRQKQAEKKRRRLEKALANSAAIRSELEKKKQKKKEEQQRLDEEGAAIAEAVALHVLVGEDSEDSCKIMLKNDERFNPWGHASNIGLFMGGRKTSFPIQGISKHCLGGLGWVPDAPGCKWSDWEIGAWTLSPGVFSRDLHEPYFGERGRGTTETSAELIAAQAVSSLQIAEDTHSDSIFINGMLESKFKEYKK